MDFTHFIGYAMEFLWERCCKNIGSNGDASVYFIGKIHVNYISFLLEKDMKNEWEQLEAAVCIDLFLFSCYFYLESYDWVIENVKKKV